VCTYCLNCDTVTSASDFWDLYVNVVAPEGARLFGRNLDAFNDALLGGSGWPGACMIEVVNWAGLKAIDQGAFLLALREIIGAQSDIQFVWADA
jgi:hypothetical protein